MHYHDFMGKVEDKLQKMSENDKIKWMKNIARTTGKHDRLQFLTSLDQKQIERSASYDKKQLTAWLKKIEDSDLYFECSSHEVYGNHYLDNDYAYEYYDSFHIGAEIEKIVNIAEDLLFQGKYLEALDVYEHLYTLSFSIWDRNMEEWEELGFVEAIEEEIITIDLKQLGLSLMYAVYQTSTGADRATKLFTYLNQNVYKDMSVEEVFTTGPEELNHIDTFIEEWIGFLVMLENDRASELLREACLLQGGINRLCEVANIHYEKHPVLYKYACEYLLNEDNHLTCERVGLGAIHVLRKNLLIRSEIARLTVKAAQQLDHFNIVETCYINAFQSHSTLGNFCRLFELSNHREIMNQATKYMETLPEKQIPNYHYANVQMKENHLSRIHKDVIKFFNEEFDVLFHKHHRDSMVLGWGSGAKGIVVPLFLLLLNKNNHLSKAEKQLIDGIFYRIGIEESDNNYFEKWLLNWREKVVLTTDQYDKYLSWVKKQVDKRTTAVVGGGFRKSYYKAAKLIVALGETLESNGEQNATARIIDHYQKEHSRKRAFKAEIASLIQE